MPIIEHENGSITYRRAAGRPALYQFKKLEEIGDSAYYAVEDAAKVRAAASNHKNRNAGWNYTSEFVDTGAGPRLKITRIALD